ncbi:MAG: hypothetical protein KDA27_23720, partial [Candidatus Eisenbacteria bacterium]|nr:hypothetical protein [Candidatus Eisenbacteria bacterium]
MRRELIPSFVSIPFALGLLVSLSSIARSGVNANGYLLLHTDDTVVYSEDDEATYCDMLSLECPFDPECDDDHSGCAMALDDLEPTSGRGPDPAVIWVIAAFPESSCPRVSAVQFGLSWPYEVELGFVGYGNCADFEIATDGWPTDLGSGTAITYGNAVRRTGFPVYWFAAYSYYGPIEVSIANFTTGPAAFADDSVPSILDNIPREHWGVV